MVATTSASGAISRRDLSAQTLGGISGWDPFGGISASGRAGERQTNHVAQCGQAREITWEFVVRRAQFAGDGGHGIVVLIQAAQPDGTTIAMATVVHHQYIDYSRLDRALSEFRALARLIAAP